MTVQLIHGDCLEFMRTLPAGSVDAVVTDPPYGLGEKWKGTNSHGWKLDRTKVAEWDSKPLIDLSPLLDIAKHLIVWGGNYYPLPPARGWLIWDKMQKHSGSDAELAWTNLDQPVRTFRMSRIEAYGQMDKQHPTQKPVDLMRWCLSFLPESCTVFDPFAGSGTTGVACVQTGRNFIGCEIDAGYFEIAKRRIEAAQMQPALGVTA